MSVWARTGAACAGAATRPAARAARTARRTMNPAAQQGFLYTPDGSTLYVRTGLDFPVQGQAPTLSIPATTNSNCTAVGLRFTSLHGTAPSFHGSIAKAARLSFTGK